MVTGFRGFSQFGLIGAAGCLFAWLATFLVMPALLCLFDRRGPQPPRVRRARPGLLPALARLIERLPAPGAGWRAAAITVVMMAGRQPVRPRPVRIRLPQAEHRQEAWTTRALRFEKEKGELFGRWPEPTVILADRAEDLPALRPPSAGPTTGASGTRRHRPAWCRWTTCCPESRTSSRRSWSCWPEIRRAAGDPAMDLLDAQGKQDARAPAPARRRCACCRPRTCPRWRGACSPRPTARMGRVLLVYPPEQGLSIWDGRACCAIASVLQRVSLPDGRQVDTSGSAVIFAAMIRSILREGPLATHRLAGGGDPAGAAAGAPAAAPPLCGDRRPAGGGRLDGGHRRLAGHEDHLPQLHRPALHLRGRRGIRHPRGQRVPRTRQRVAAP